MEEPFYLYFQNVRGLKLSEGDHFTTQAMGVLKSVEALVVCLAETNTDWKHPDAHHRVFSQFCMCFSLLWLTAILTWLNTRTCNRSEELLQVLVFPY